MLREKQIFFCYTWAMNWSTRRQLVILFLICIVGISVLAFFILPYVFKDPTCSDGIKNGTETGIDCGGTCSLLCKEDASSLEIVWSRTVPVTATSYDAAAYIKNNNINAALRSIRYKFTLYDTFGGVIVTREGSTPILPNSITPIVETGIDVGPRVPVRSRLTFIDDGIVFQKIDKSILADLQVKSTDFSNSTGKPMLEAHLTNPTDKNLQNITWLALLYDADDTLLATGKTITVDFPKESDTTIFFTWKQSITKPTRIEVVPVADPFNALSPIQ